MTYARLRAAALVPALALLALAASGCGDSLAAPGVGASAQTTDALALLPTDATVYGMTNLAAARESDALDAALGGTGLGMVSGRGSDDFDAFVRMTGFDPSQDLDRIYVAGRADAQGQPERMAIVAYGRFDRDRIEQYVASQDQAEFEVSDIDGIPLYLAADSAGQRAGFALANGQMVLGGDETTLRGMVSRLGTSSQAAPSDLQALFDRVAYPDGAWFVARGIGAGVPGNAPLPAQAADGLVVSMAFQSDGVPVRGFLETKPGASPDDVADVIRGGIAAARVGMKDEPAALDVLDDVEVEAEDGGVRVEGFLTPAFLAASAQDR